MKQYQVVQVYSQQLKKEKNIYIYVPKSYNYSKKRYPVLYMHDGQNLFDDRIAFMNTSWNIVKIYDKNPDLPEVIIIGIESDEDRSDELVPYEFSFQDGKKAGGNADRYLSFITQTLKPYIDLTFRTYKSRNNTGIMGSSFGGVNSTYAAFKYSTYFTRFGCVSNAYYYGELFDALKALAKSSNLDCVNKFYMDVGLVETEDKKINKKYLDSNNEIYEILKEKIPKCHLQFNIVDDGIHHETAWEKRFPEIIKFLFND